VRRIAGALLVLALVIGGVVAMGGDEDRPDEAPPREEPTWRPPEPTFPLALHSEPPGAEGDVSRAFVDPDGEHVTLNAVNIFPIAPDSPTSGFDADDYRSIRAKGFNAVRFLLPWAVFEPEPGRFQYLEELDRSVRLARDAGLYVVMLNIIVDEWNSPPAWATGRDKIEQIATGAQAWTQELARRYRGEHAVAAYDLAAELPSTNQNRLLRVYDRMISWVRAIDPDKILITTAGWGNSDMSPRRANAALIAGHENVVHSFHDYYAGDGNAGSVSVGYDGRGMNAGNQTWDGIGGYPQPGDQADFAAQLEHQAEYARRAGVPLWVSEYGVNPEAPNAQEWVAQKTELYDRYGLSRAWWLYTCGENFGLKDEACSWRPIADAVS
jgi:hypothetical protein